MYDLHNTEDEVDLVILTGAAMVGSFLLLRLSLYLDLNMWLSIFLGCIYLVCSGFCLNFSMFLAVEEMFAPIQEGIQNRKELFDERVKNARSLIREIDEDTRKQQELQELRDRHIENPHGILIGNRLSKEETRKLLKQIEEENNDQN